MATIFKLIIEDDEGKTTVYPLTDGSVSIGRKEGNTIRLMERNVSRRHARLLKNNGAVFIEDLDSYNGIRINGERIAGRYEVKEGDLVEIGDYHLALQRSEVAEEKKDRDGWPQPGTLPDIRLPDEMTQGAAERAHRDTVIDQPVPPNVPGAVAQTVERGALDQPLPPSQPLVKPPPRGETGGGDLPPFPGPGGLAPPKSPMYGESSQATEAAPSKLSVGPSYVSSVPRLVCVSTSYAGKEFALTRPELIIGRVEDNDIVIEHRSVSRNHAKILFDGRTHKIIDLQSANGILVNGEEYAMTDLRKGDLIELGHVRFRFIPADEPFVATDEEAREMREAGVEPPSPPKDAPKNGEIAAGLVAPGGAPAAEPSTEAPLPAYDPSTAATVTDTPLDALGMGDLAAPSVDAAPTSKPKRATEDERPTQLTDRPPDRGGAPRAGAAAYAATVPDSAAPEPLPRARTRADSEVEPPSEGPKRGLLFVIAALLVTALVLLTLVVSGGGGGERQEALQKAFLAEDWKTVKQLYEDDPTDFDDPKSALGLYNQAKEALDSAKRAAPSPPSSAADLPKGDADSAAAEPAPDPEPLEPMEEPAPEREPEMELPAGDAEDKPKVTRRRRRAKRPKPTKPRNTDTLAADGFRAMSNGDYTTAERILKRCLAVDASSAQCHRTLGVLYAYIDDPQRSLYHYKRYVELQPNAPDAAKVRDMIRSAEQQAGKNL